jgi:hypothetical protein
MHFIIFCVRHVFHVYLSSADFPPDEIIAIVARKTGCQDKGKITAMLKEQRSKCLERMKAAQTEIRRVKSAEEQAKLDKVKSLGLCPVSAVCRTYYTKILRCRVYVLICVYI